MRYIYSIVIVVTFFLITNTAQAVWVWTPETGKWVNPKYAPKDTSKEQFDFALSLFQSEDYKKARKEFEKIIKFYPASVYAPDSQYYVGRCFEELNSPYHAFRAYQKVIDSYPYSEKIEDIIERQYMIGVYYFDYEKNKHWGPTFAMPLDKAIEIFKKVVDNSPYGAYGDVAQYKLGETYRKMHNYLEASMAFQKLLDNYPHSQFREDATYQVAYCTSEASLRPDYDQQMTEDAIEDFEDFIDRRPDSELAKNAEGTVEVLKEKQAKTAFDTAHFYERQKKYLSAYTYYKEIIEEYPESSYYPEAKIKAEMLEGIGNW